MQSYPSESSTEQGLGMTCIQHINSRTNWYPNPVLNLLDELIAQRCVHSCSEASMLCTTDGLLKSTESNKSSWHSAQLT
eukprot:scaffold560587_cov31-Prasinocladus_malaysianus.AAC.1